MKKAVISIFLAALIMLSACSGEAEATVKKSFGELTDKNDANENGADVVTQGRYMVYDGEYIYCCPAGEGSYSMTSYENYFGLDVVKVYKDEAPLNPILRCSKATDAQLEVFYEADCEWLCIDDGRIYFVNKDEISVCSMLLDGSDLHTEYKSESEYDTLGAVCHRDNTLYFIDDGSLYRRTDDGAEMIFDVVLYCENCEQGEYINNWMVQDLRVVSEGIYFILWGWDMNLQDVGRLMFLPNDSEEAQYVAESGEYICQDWDTVYFLYRSEEQDDFGDYICRLASVRVGEEPLCFGRDLNARTLFISDGCLFYDSYEFDITQWVDYDVSGYETTWMEERYIFAYDLETADETMLAENMHPMYIDGVAGNVLWYEFFYDNVWVYMVDSKPIKETPMSSERFSVFDTGEYGPGVSYLLLESPANMMSAFRLLRTDESESEEFFVILQPGEERTMEFPSGTYILKVAEGDEWLSDEEAFGPTGSYSRTEAHRFYENNEYYISAGTTGDFRGDSSSGFVS